MNERETERERTRNTECMPSFSVDNRHTMKNSLRLSRYNTRYYHDYQDPICHDYTGKTAMNSLLNSVRSRCRRNQISVGVRGLQRLHLRSVPAASGVRSRMARPMPEMLRVRAISRRDSHVFRAQREDLLQIRLRTVRVPVLSSNRPTKEFDLQKLSPLIIIAVEREEEEEKKKKRKINTLQTAYVSSRQTTSFDKR